MVRFFKSTTINRLLLCSVLTSFTLAVITPQSAYADININDIAFYSRIEKLSEKMRKYKEKQDSNKLLDTMLEIKREVEERTGNRIDLDKEFNKAKIEINARGAKIPEKDFESLRKIIKRKEKKANQKAMCQASYLELAPNMSFDEYEILYLSANGNDKDKDDNKEITELPLRLTIGISMVLGGGFLCFAGAMLKIPICVECGKNLTAAGITFAVEGYVNSKEKNKDN